MWRNRGVYFGLKYLVLKFEQTAVLMRESQRWA
jgi:hypothetical protein